MRQPLRRVPAALLAILVAGGCGASSPTPTSTSAPSSGPSVVPSIAPSPTVPVTPAITGTIAVEPPVALVDEPVAIRLSGFPPDSEVTVRATTVGRIYPDATSSGGVRTSAATFRTDEDGEVDLTTAVPISASYEIANAMGLFWSMKDAQPGEVTTTASPPPDSPDPVVFVPYRYEISAEVDGQQVATATLDQHLGSPDVTMREISEDGLLGQFYLPSGPGPHPAVIMVAGSSGGLATRRPKALAARGYAVLSLPYFNYTSPLDGTQLPPSTVDLPLEYFGKAIAWMQEQPAVDPDRIAMYGTSLGGDVAMLVGARYPEIKSVIAISPPTATWDGGTGHSSFSFEGKPLPYVTPFGLEDLARPFSRAATAGDDPLTTVPGIVESINANPEMEAAIARVEQVRGSVLIVSGTADVQLPATVYGELAIDRLVKHQFAFPYRHIVGHGAGHGIDFPGVDRSLEISEGGGTPEANELAGEAMWPVVLEYLAAMK